MRVIQVQNVKFFRKKGVLDMLAINRGVSCTWLGVTRGGGLVVKVARFDRYFFDPETCEVFARSGPREYRAMKRYNDGGAPYYYLWRNGNRERITLGQILRENLKGIETFYSDDNREGRKGRNDLHLVSE